MENPSKNIRSNCPLSIALDTIGDKWSLLIVRDMCLNKKRFADFLSSPENIPTNILAERLRRLESAGIIEKKSYLLKPVRYEYFLTAKGSELLPVLQQLAIWTHKHVPDAIAPPVWFLNARPENLTKCPDASD